MQCHGGRRTCVLDFVASVCESTSAAMGQAMFSVYGKNQLRDKVFYSL